MNENHQLNGDRGSSNIRAEQLTAYALGQLAGDELAAVERQLAAPARQAMAETRRLADGVKAAAEADHAPARSPQLRAAILAQLEKQADQPPVEIAPRGRSRRLLAWLAVGTAAAVLAGIAIYPSVQANREAARRSQARNQFDRIDTNFKEMPALRSRSIVTSNPNDHAEPIEDLAFTYPGETTTAPQTGPIAAYASSPDAADAIIPSDPATTTSPATNELRTIVVGAGGSPANQPAIQLGNTQGEGQPGTSADGYAMGYGSTGGGSNQGGAYYPGGVSGMMSGGGQSPNKMLARNLDSGIRAEERSREAVDEGLHQWHSRGWAYDAYGREQYALIVENSFLAPADHPLSTFSIDVDTASYSNVRRFLMGGRLPPPAAVRIEELVNYFSYSYPQPKGPEPFSVNMETAECPWQPGHVLLRVGLKGKEIHRAERPPSNLVFLLDVSGSMADQNKLPLLKTSLLMFVAELTENDRVSIVTYAGDAGLRLPPTSGDQKAKIMQAIESLAAGGSTHGSAGIQLAYEQAGQYFIKDGANRVILATDGDLNVGITQDDALVELIKGKAAAGTFLTVLGFGEGNLQDAKLEKLADNGNGMYAYIDSVREGRKVLVEQMSGSTVTIAKDVKIQIEFNPAQIASYRLLGYENRVLAAKDFNDDKKDAGEIGAGHTVTALYELVPVGMKQAAAQSQPVVEPLKYQRTGDRRQGTGEQESGAVGSALRGVPGSGKLTEAAASGELLTLKLRYKAPDGIESRLIEFPLKERGGQFNAASKDLQFAAAVASFGMILRGSEHKGSGSLAAVSEIAGGAIGDDPGGYRAEFVDLVRRAQALGAK